MDKALIVSDRRRSGNRLMMPNSFNGRLLSDAEKRQIRQMIESKIKLNLEEGYFLVVSASASNITYSGANSVLTAVPTGDVENTRVGDQITVKSLWLSYQLFAATTTDVIRVVIFVWKPSTVPTVAQILSDPGNFTAPLSSYFTDTQQQYEVLWSKTHYMSVSLNSVDGYTFFKKKMSHKIQFTNNTTTGSNQIYVLFISNQAGSTYPQSSIHSKIEYIDG